MNLALVLGNSSESIKPKLVSVKDNLSINCFSDIQSFLNDSIRLEYHFDRVLILSTLIKNDSYISDLYNYWSNTNRGMEIVLICRKTNDDELAKRFLSKFCSISVTTMSVASTTLHTLGDAVVLPVKKIAETYGVSDYLDVEVESDSYEEKVEQNTSVSSEVSHRPEKPINSPVTQRPVSERPIENNQGKEKRTLLGVLFGKKKKDAPQQISSETNNNISNNNIENTIEGSENISRGQYSQIQQETPLREPVYTPNVSNETDEYEDYETQYEEENYEDDFDFSEENSVTSSSLEENNNDSFSDDYYSDNEETVQSDSYSTEEFNEYFEEDSSSEYSSDDQSSGYEVEEDFGDLTYTDTGVQSQQGSATELEEEVEEDFGDLTYTDTDTRESIPQKRTEVVKEVEEDDLGTDLSVGSDEDEYRRKTEQPKIIKETVVREVIKSVKTSSVLDGVYRGISHKIVIVTGDRGSGITTFCWNLAMHFAQKTQVLYFDCDTKNHGLMNYIDYFNFKNYEESHMKGVKLCRNSRAFDSCVCRWGTNIDLLTSDFDVDITDDELILAQGVVAENLNKYGVIIVDCPLSKLHCIQDLILTGNVVLCVEENRRGYMNTLLALDSSELPLRYKRNIINKGTLVRTKVNPKTDYNRLIKYIKSIVDLEDCNWFDMVTTQFTGKVTEELLAEILEG